MLGAVPHTLTCPSCGTSVPARAEFCPRCLGQVAPRAPVSERAAAPEVPAPMAVAAIEALAAPKVDPFPAPDIAPICPQHALEPAAKCRQCSAFYCPRCVPADGKRALCLSCNTTLAVREAPEKLRTLFRELWISPLIMGLTVLAVILVLIATSHPMVGIVFGLMASAPFFLLALVIALARSIAAAWIGFALELLCLLFMLGGGLGIFTFVAAIIPLMTVFQIVKTQELLALLKAQPTKLARPQ
jgi:hypothetical protein